MTRKPKISKEQRHANGEAMYRRFTHISNLCVSLVERSPYHWTCFFENGERLEVYPGSLATGGAQHVVYYQNREACILSIEEAAKSANARSDDDLIVIDDYDIFGDAA